MITTTNIGQYWQKSNDA